MKNLELIRARYLQDNLPRRLGALAANLARIASFSKLNKSGNVIESLLRESTYFIEWTGKDANLELQDKLVQLQIRLAWWAYRLQKGVLPSQELIHGCELEAEALLAISDL